MGYVNTTDALTKHVDQEDKQLIQRSQFATLEIPNRGLMVINESGFYSLITIKKEYNWGWCTLKGYIYSLSILDDFIHK